MAVGISVEVQVASTATGIPETAEIRDWVEAVVRRFAADGAVEVSVRIVDADESRALNRDYRGKDRETNVLSFPAGDDGLPPDVARPLGDLVICAPVVLREAGEQGKSVADHWGHLLVHGSLHLLGFDHETDAEASAMEGLEREILAARGVADPYLA